MRNMPNGAERQHIVDRMNEIFRHDAPWIGGFHPKNFGLFHGWLGNAKVNEISGNNLKYLRVDAAKRAAMRREWNQPVVWPAILILVLLAVSIVPAVRTHLRRERMAARPAA
jgi:hypothetical protein